MNFTLTEERQMLQDGLRRYLRDTVTPELLEDATESVSGHSETLWQGLAEMGVIGALFSEEDGGFGGAGFDIALTFEEMGRAGAFEPIGISCRICERVACHQRSVPPLERKLRIAPDRRGVLPYELE